MTGGPRSLPWPFSRFGWGIKFEVEQEEEHGWDKSPVTGESVLDDVLRAKRAIERQVGLEEEESE